MRTRFLFAVIFLLSACGGDNPVTPPVVAVVPPPPTPPTPPTLSVGSQLDSLVVSDTVLAVAIASSASGSPLSVTPTWSSSDTGVVRISPTGLAIAKSPGRAVITASIPSGVSSGPATVSNTRSITVTADTPTRFSLTLPDTVAEALAFTVQPQVLGRHGKVISTGLQLQYSSSDRSVISIDADGLAVPGIVGQANLTVTTGTLTQSASIRVTKALVPIRLFFRQSSSYKSKAVAYAAAARWQRVFSAPLTGPNVTIPTMADNVCLVPAKTYTPADGILISVIYDNSNRAVGQYCELRLSSKGKYVTVTGSTQIDSTIFTRYVNPDNKDVPLNIFIHEIGHTLGFLGNVFRGTEFGKLLVGMPGPDPRFTGPVAMEQYRLAGGTATGGVPISPFDQAFCLDACAYTHWRGSHLDGETMGTGNQGALSRITLGAMIDIGYDIDLTKADPYIVKLQPGAPTIP